MLFSTKWLQNHPKFLLHFLIHIDFIYAYIYILLIFEGLFFGLLTYSYAKYWKQRLLSLTHEQLSDIFPVIQTNPETRNGRNVKNAWNARPISVCIVDLPERYFLFSDSVPEDKDLREFLRMKRLVRTISTFSSPSSCILLGGLAGIATF